MKLLDYVRILACGLVAVCLAASSPVLAADAAEPSPPAAEASSPPAVAVESPGLSDPAFDRYVDLGAVGEAVEGLHAPSLIDAALQLAEGERVLLRGHASGLTADRLFSAALETAQLTKDDESLKRLADAAKALEKPDWEAKLKAVQALVDESRSDSGPKVEVHRLSLEGVHTYWAFLREAWRARIVRDAPLLEALEKKSAEEPTMIPPQRDALKRVIEAGQESASQPPAVADAVLRKLSHEARWGIKISTPKISVPKISTPKIPTPRIPTPRIPTPRIPTPRIPSPRIPSPRIPTIKIPSPKFPTTRFSGPTIRRPDFRVPTPSELGRSVTDRFKRTPSQQWNQRVRDPWVRGVADPSGRAWNRNIRDPWKRNVSDPFFWKATGAEAVDKGLERGQEQFDDARSKIPSIISGENCDYRDLPGGSAKTETWGPVYVDAPSGGVIGHKLWFLYKGRQMRITVTFQVVQGSARPVVRRSDGTIMAAGAWRSASFNGRQSVQIDLPDDQSSYVAGLQLSSGAKCRLTLVYSERI